MLAHVWWAVALALTLILMIAGAASLETLTWWAGWNREGRSAGRRTRAFDVSIPTGHVGAAPTSAEAPAEGPFIVFLSGAGILDPADIDQRDSEFLDRVQERLPGATMVRDIFPYSPTGQPLTGPLSHRRSSRFYAYALSARKAWHRNIWQCLSIHVQQLRNVLTVGVSGDRRYGPMYSFGLSQVIAASLLGHGYRPGSRQPVILMAISGGGQMAQGCAPFLRRMLGTPVWLISIGSVLTDDPGILDFEHVFHLAGSRDHIQYIGRFFYPGLWPICRDSAYNQARRQGKLTVIDAGPMVHMKRGDYLSRSALLPNGQHCVDRTLDLVTQIVGTIQTMAAGSPQRTGAGALPPAGRRVYTPGEGSQEGAVAVC